MPRLTPCPSCHVHVFANERSCPHCGAELPRTLSARVPALLVGLALTGCPEPEPVYGVPDPGPEDSDSDSDTSTSTETETGVDSETTTVGEPEYGVPDSG